MKKFIRRLLGEQDGQVLPLAFAMLALGSLIVVPLLNLTETTLKTGTRNERQMYEQYAANAGVMDGVREIVADSPSLPAPGNSWSYSIPDVNNRAVAVTVDTIDQNNWKITSTATTDNVGSTQLECYLERARYFPNAITAESVTINSDATINGDVQYDSALGTLTNNGTINGEIKDRQIAWPTADDVAANYQAQVDGAPTHEGDLTLSLGPATITNPYSLGPIYIDGNLTINSPSQGAARLDGIVYVTGSVAINQNVRLYQNSETIYADGAGGLVTQLGSTVYDGGCLISRDSISLSGSRTANNYSIVWSLMGSVWLNSKGTLLASVYSGELNTSGQITVNNGRVITYQTPPEDILLPLLPRGAYRVVDWESTTQ